MQSRTEHDTDSVSASEVLMSWNRQRSTEELKSFIIGRHSKLEDIELGI
jgi:hypothetical protein